MNSCVFLCVAFLIVGAAYADIAADVIAKNKACAKENNISKEQLATVRGTHDKYSIDASDDLKCFAKCVLERNNLVTDSLNGERLFELSTAMGHKETKIRSNIEKCKELKASNLDCADSWNMYACILDQ